MFNTEKNSVAEPDHRDVAFAKREACDLAQALTIVFHKERLERLLQEYRVVAIEPEIRATLHEDARFKVMLMSRPDAILERISDGALLQWELKTKQSVNKNWLDSWEHNLQLVGQQVAIKQWACDHGRSDRLIAGAHIEALIKGKREKDDYTGQWRQSTPLIYAYTKAGDGLAVPDQISPTWKRGWTKRLVSEFQPLEQWIQHDLSPEITVLKCVLVPPIAPSEWEIANATKQWALGTIKAHLDANKCYENDELLAAYFPQNSEHCWHYGRCSFYDLCFGSAGQDPIGSGLYTPRQANHPEAVVED